MNLSSVKESINNLKNTKALVVLGLLTAIYVVLSYFTFYFLQTLRVSFTFIPLAMAGAIFGPVAAGFVGALGDFLGYITSQFGAGAYNIGFTINAFIIGVIYGLFLYKSNFSIIRIIFAKIILVIIVELVLTPLWLSVLYGDSYIAIMLPRVLKTVIFIPVEVFIIKFIIKKIYDYLRGY